MDTRASKYRAQPRPKGYKVDQGMVIPDDVAKRLMERAKERNRGNKYDNPEVQESMEGVISHDDLQEWQRKNK